MNLVECSASTSEYVAVHAAMEPQRPAILIGNQVVSYGQVYQQIKNFTVALHELGIQEGDKCIVNVSHPYVHWLLLLALENLAAMACSVRPGESSSLLDLMRCMDKHISQDPAPQGAQVELIHMSVEWVQAQLNARVDEVRYREVLRFLAPHAGQRIKRTSGTTGGMKTMVSSNQGEEAYLKGYAEIMGFTRDTRYLVANGFVIGSVHLCATLCLRLGSLVIFDRGENRLELIKRHRVTHLRLFPQQLLDTLKEMEAGALPKPKDLTLILGAAPVSRILWDRVMEMFASHIVYTYNTNECASICVMGPEGVGAVRAGVQVSIVGPDDRVLERGQTGRIRVKVPTMVQSYLDNPEASRNNFKDGWFYTGDAGHFIDTRRIKLVGRVDDVLNFAGFKNGADEYEAQVCKVTGIQEACAMAAPDALGVDRLGICAVAAPAADKKAMVQALKNRFPPYISEGARVYFVDRLPKTETGKLQRSSMKMRLPELTGGYAL